MKRALLACLAVLALAAIAPPAVSQQPADARLDQLLAPVALYPDPLLAHVLAASTYPLEVVALDRWLQQNPGLEGDALDAAVAQQPWDESVKALAPFRSVVAMMDGELDWTQRLGDAFLADEAAVMDAVQRLRAKARANGALVDSERERIVEQGGTIIIEPAAPDTVYVPVYDPRVVYGSWWWPEWPPYVWGPYYWGPWDYVAGGVYFGLGIYAGHAWHDHWHADWGRHDLVKPRPGGHDTWQHQPSHRDGVPYVDPRSRDRYHPPARDPGRARSDFRGFDVPPRVTGPGGNAPHTFQQIHPRPPQVPRTSPISPIPQDVARQHAERGHQSLGPRPAPSGGGHSGSSGGRPSR